MKQNQAMEMAMEMLELHGFVPMGEPGKPGVFDGRMILTFETKPTGQSVLLHREQSVRIDICPGEQGMGGNGNIFAVTVSVNFVNVSGGSNGNTLYFIAGSSDHGNEFFMPTSYYNAVTYGSKQRIGGSKPRRHFPCN